MTDRSSLDSLTGRLIGGRYRLERLIASGGMAQVWEATDETLSRRVAVKLLHPHLAADASFLERFKREAIAAARLSHSGIVSIYDTCSDDQVEAIVMELVHGSTLREYLDEHPMVEPGQAVAILAEVADALDTAHRSGVIHRDIKPANILLSTDGRVLVADFGIAKAGNDLTATNTTLGTAKYLAPEQVEGSPVDARTDVYALGVVLYEMLCGRTPFSADTAAATALARLHQEPMRPRNVRAGIPKPLEAVVMRALARNPDDRYPSAGAFRADLLVAGRDSPASPVRPNDSSGGDPTMAVAPPAPRDTTPTGAPPPAFVRTERGWLVPTLVIIVVAAALIVAGVLVTGNKKNGNNTASGTTGQDGTVTISKAAAFDPAPGDGVENDADVPKTIDGDPGTVWQTQGYNNQSFGGLKPGVGLSLTLQGSVALDKLTIQSPTNDWSVQIYVSNGAHPDLGGWGQPVASKDHIPSGTNTFDLGGHSGSAVLVWITYLGDGQPDSSGRFHAQIAELALTAK
ncbi:MAG TPA: protein kinase [Acidimicrobiales bacterium]